MLDEKSHEESTKGFKARSSVASPTFQATGAFAGTSSGATMPFAVERAQQLRHDDDDIWDDSHIGINSPGGTWHPTYRSIF